ncbi:MAG: dehydrogenase, partial [Verrucomicrobia bacterium]|nr:dehydrogenase [Verrucomicrobiota bacterium]
MTPRFKAVNVDCNFDYAYERQRLEAMGVELILRKAATEDEIIAACRDADAVVLEGAKTPITARVIESLARCRLIAKYAVGVDNVDVAAATSRGIVVANAADYCTEEVSDHAVALLLASVRRVMAADRHVHAGNWAGFSRTRPLRRISALTLGLVGMGRIARATARKMAGFRMKILAADPYVAGMAKEPGVEFVPLDRLLKEADLISVHVPLTNETRGLLNEAAFRSMKPNAIVVNKSRGPVIDEPALIRALEEKWISGAALDVV